MPTITDDHIERERERESGWVGGRRFLIVFPLTFSSINEIQIKEKLSQLMSKLGKVFLQIVVICFSLQSFIAQQQMRKIYLASNFFKCSANRV